MPRKLATPFRYLAAGIYVRRVGDAIQVVTTGDDHEPDLSKTDQSDGLGGSNVVESKANWLTEQQVSVEQFGDIINELAPESRGQLVNVGTEEEPFLLTQQQAAQFGAHVEVAAEALAASAAQTALPEAAVNG